MSPFVFQAIVLSLLEDNQTTTVVSEIASVAIAQPCVITDSLVMGNNFFFCDPQNIDMSRQWVPNKNPDVYKNFVNTIGNTFFEKHQRCFSIDEIETTRFPYPWQKVSVCRPNYINLDLFAPMNPSFGFDGIHGSPWVKQ